MLEFEKHLKGEAQLDKSTTKKTTVAVFADIHSNLHALMAVLDDIDSRKPDFILCAGDLVGYGPYPNEVVKTIKERGIPTVMGNYDDAIAYFRPVCGCDYKSARAQEIGEHSIMFTKKHTSEESKALLAALPSSIFLRIVHEGAMLSNNVPNWAPPLEDKEKEKHNTATPVQKPKSGNWLLHLVHGSPRQLNEYLKLDTPVETFKQIAALIPANILVYGHTHQSYHKFIDDVHFINVGSAGKPKLGNPNVNYAWLEISEQVKVDFIEVPYNKEATMSAMAEYNLPEELINIIATGID
ncbi:metallophosphoesterase family protein [Desulfolucanica intricata]|uniref:metallophosphoesterase family protein n=1 Tax=Desulfolucanica intricata TaxID=1285191 RepID=UPI000836D696|nr:metallophosphoesterase family protein [Desulfolucanica intricata]